MKPLTEQEVQAYMDTATTNIVVNSNKVLRLCEDWLRLREQRDEGMKREADFIKKWADAEDRLARVTNEAKRQFEEWAEHLRACSDQCAKAEEKVARVTAALDWYADHKTDQGRYDGELWGDLNALVAVEEPAE